MSSFVRLPGLSIRNWKSVLCYLFAADMNLSAFTSTQLDPVKAVVKIYASQKAIFDFLLVFHCNYIWQSFVVFEI